MRKLKYIFTMLCVLLLLDACEDDVVTSVYSRKYKVRCGFTVVSHVELVNCIDNYGQFSTIRQKGDKIIMKSAVSANEYNVDAISKDYFYGLGGLIVGTPNLSSDDQRYRAYDLACPNCDRANYRLTVGDEGFATCGHCCIVYDLNNDGIIIDKGSSDFTSPRVLYRYRIYYDGNMIHVTN